MSPINCENLIIESLGILLPVVVVATSDSTIIGALPTLELPVLYTNLIWVESLIPRILLFDDWIVIP